MAFVAEVIMAFGMMLMVLTTSNHPRLARFTGVLAGVLVMSFVILSSPVSGFSINPARTLSSAIPAMAFPSLWIYLTAPFIGMLGAAALYRKAKGVVMCAKMHHDSAYDCIFNCGYCTHGESNDAKADPISAPK
jgi:aquaporin Z